MLMLDISLEPGWTLDIPIASDLTAFAYTLYGEIAFGNEKAQSPKRAVLFGKGDSLRLKSDGTGPARCAFFAGKPLHEPVAWGGPIVMNSNEELDLAFKELDEGTFIKE
jgi:redox-sensitive bicupin YhaK (pirin superfamily)